MARLQELLYFVCILSMTTITVSARAVNITNTWVLPEEGFPVFYRYFRDRISWNEADAVCQFHHGNLVTVDTTSQYDAVRAYLKELDIANNVWIGLSRLADKSEFTWRDFRVLSANSYWQEAIPTGNDPLCVASDPAADYQWHALSCTGPTVASFICELPVPSWALGPSGCLLTELPSLTVLFIPEESAVELTSDCGLDGTRRIACKGNMNREDLMKRLSCLDIIEEKTQSPTITTANHESTSNSHLKTTKPWLWTSNTIDTEEYSLPTRHRRGTDETSNPSQTTKSTTTGYLPKKSNVKEDSISVTTDSLIGTTVVSTVTENVEGTTTETEAFTSATISSSSTAKTDGNEEYPSSINQGQLFSIIENVFENGTMFDLIEMNGTYENKTTSNLNTSPTPSPDNSSPLYTTVIYHKEPTEGLITTTHYKSSKTTNKVSMNDIPAQKNTKTLSKEIEIIPEILNTGGSVKLNRTNRKELPLIYKSEINIDVDNRIDASEEKEGLGHKTVEIRIQKPGFENETKSTIFVTTRRTTIDKNNKNAKGVTSTKAPNEGVRPDNIKEETLDSEPTTKPNRQRQLTRPQRRSFYPYFFSRVLG